MIVIMQEDEMTLFPNPCTITFVTEVPYSVQEIFEMSIFCHILNRRLIGTTFLNAEVSITWYPKFPSPIQDR